MEMIGLAWNVVRVSPERRDNKALARGRLSWRCPRPRRSATR